MNSETFDNLSLEDIKKAISDVEESLADLETELRVTFSSEHHRHIAPAEANAEMEAMRQDKERLLAKKQQLLAALSKKLGERK